ncbi:MAG: muramoyltetrapeptide carboxypeptidase [Pseudomonadota bacterium]
MSPMPPVPRTIAIVAPSGYAADPAAFQRGLERLRALGHTVKDFSASEGKHQRFAATDAGRVAQLHAAANDPDVELVIALRGGYGLSRILPDIDFNLLAHSRKLWVGHSDFTALQMGLLEAGSDSFAGPMICDDFSRDEVSEFTHTHFWQCLSRPSMSLSVAAIGNPAISAHGRLWGGNLAMLAHLAGTRWMPHIERGILFVEDINEHPYRVERMLLQLWHAGLLKDQQAILLGDFSGYKLTDYDNGYDFSAMADWLSDRFGTPILQGLPFGHIRDKLTLPVGADCRLTSDGAGFRLELSGYPSLD